MGMKLQDVKEQIQQDIISLREEYDWNDNEVDDLCQIVVDNFNKFEDSKKGQFIPFGGNIS